MEKNNPLSPRSSVQPPAYNHLSFCKEECQHSQINPEHVWSMRNKSQSGDGMLYPQSSPREASSFKFSVSRLPKWAQAKVISPNNVCKNLNCTSSEVCVLKFFLSFFFFLSSKTSLYFNPPSPLPTMVFCRCRSLFISYWKPFLNLEIYLNKTICIGQRVQEQI